jgi:hypothetical protein
MQKEKHDDILISELEGHWPNSLHTVQGSDLPPRPGHIGT